MVEEEEEDWECGGAVDEEMVARVVSAGWRVGDATCHRDASALEGYGALLLDGLQAAADDMAQRAPGGARAQPGSLQGGCSGVEGRRQWSRVECERLRCAIRVLRRALAHDSSLSGAKHLLAKAWLLLATALATASLPPAEHDGWDDAWRLAPLHRCFPVVVKDNDEHAPPHFCAARWGADRQRHCRMAEPWASRPSPAAGAADAERQAARGHQHLDALHGQIVDARRRAAYLLTQVVQEDGRNVAARLLLARELVNIGEPARAMQHLRATLAHSPAHPGRCRRWPTCCRARAGACCAPSSVPPPRSRRRPRRAA